MGDLAFDLASLSVASDFSGKQSLARGRTNWRSAAALSVVAAALLAAAFFLGMYLQHSPVPHFQRLTFQLGQVFTARFAPDHETVLYSAAWSANPPEVFSTVAASQHSRALGISNADLLAVSSKGELAVLLRPNLDMAGFLHVGTLARVGMTGGTALREMANDIDGADWSPDGSNLAVLRVDRKNNVDILEYRLGKDIYHSSRPDWLSHVRVSPDGHLIAILQHSGFVDHRGRVLVFDTTGALKFKSAMWDGVYGQACPREIRRVQEEIWIRSIFSCAVLSKCYFLRWGIKQKCKPHSRPLGMAPNRFIATAISSRIMGCIPNFPRSVSS